MADRATTDSPLEAAAEVAGPRATEAFSLLGNETRLAILLALWEETDPFAADDTDYTEGDAIAFSALRDRVGMRDSGQFHYHLDQLVGRFVQRTEDGYELHPAGEAIVRTVIASTGFEDQPLAVTAVDAACPNCGSPTSITYQNQRLYQLCRSCPGNYTLGENHPDGVLNGWRSNPAVLSHPSAEAIYEAGRTEATHRYALRFAGVCPTCSGRVERGFHVCPDHETVTGPCPTCRRPYEVAARFVCTVCKAANICSAVKLVLLTRIPAVEEFLGEHGLVPEYPFATETAGLEIEQAVTSTDPLRVEMTLTVDGDELVLRVDGDLNVARPSG